MTRINLSIQSVIVGGMLLLFAVIAKAQIPAPYGAWNLEVQSGAAQQNYAFTAPSAYSLNASSANYGSAMALETGTLGSDPSVTAFATASGAAGESSASADSTLTFGFSIVNLGSGTATSIPIITTGSGYASWSGTGEALYGNGSALAQASFGTLAASGQTLATTIASWFAQATPSSSQSASFSMPLTDYNLSPTTVYGMYMNVEVNGFGEGAGASGTGSAYVDPQIMIDPSFAQANDYEIVFAPGVLPAPEPSSGLVLALGGAVLLCVRRFRAPFTARFSAKL